ncbi:hypothetical protein T552_03545 [Pneumocystis carinii B80]|uniref:Uncharacterized protein n=1 Tax=Pneumocystis carinii (strain B80) TaxID=1408658 RepID=A0A0W4ZB69_PNEC8|nr:hypothetical protein T552_03545 [Pneumocystis carinii B80]KTW25684.1 hypothetical protein T552_03545 [Pneumocystis carinii B80]
MPPEDHANSDFKPSVSQTSTKESLTPRSVISKTFSFFSPSAWKQNYKNSRKTENKPLKFKNESQDGMEYRNCFQDTSESLENDNIVEEDFFKKRKNDEFKDTYTPQKSFSSDISFEDNKNMLFINSNIPKMSEKDILSDRTLTPNEILSSFFSKKGNSPLNTIEIEGVISLMSKNTTSNIDFSSFVTPLKASQQSLFSLNNSAFSPTCDSTVKFGSSVSTFSHSKKYSTFGPTISTPFRKRRSTRRSSFYMNNTSKQPLPSKYDLLATIGMNENENTKSGDKHELDIMLAPEAKRRHVDSTFLDKNSSKKMPLYISETSQNLNSDNFKFAKSRTAINILNILDKEKNEEHIKTEVDIQSVLSPYAMPSSRRTPSKHGISSNIITQKKKQKSIAEKIGETMHFNALSKSINKTNYQTPEIPYKKYKPIISSNLQNVISLGTGENYSNNNNTEINDFKEFKNILPLDKVSIPKNLTSDEIISMKKNPIVFQTFKDNKETSNSFSTTGFSSEPEINNKPLTIYPINKHNNPVATASSSFLNKDKIVFGFSEKADEIENTSIINSPLNQKNHLTKETSQTTESLKFEIFKINPNLLPWFSFTISSSKEFKNNLKNILLIPETQLRKYIFTTRPKCLI